MSELTKIRIDLLKQMHKYIIEIGDEEIYLDWVTLAVPDEPSDGDYEFIAESDEEWTDVCEVFGKLTKADYEENH